MHPGFISIPTACLGVCGRFISWACQGLGGYRWVSGGRGSTLGMIYKEIMLRAAPQRQAGSPQGFGGHVLGTLVPVGRDSLRAQGGWGSLVCGRAHCAHTRCRPRVVRGCGAVGGCVGCAGCQRCPWAPCAAGAAPVGTAGRGCTGTGCPLGLWVLHVRSRSCSGTTVRILLSAGPDPQP